MILAAASAIDARREGLAVIHVPKGDYQNRFFSLSHSGPHGILSILLSCPKDALPTG